MSLEKAIELFNQKPRKALAYIVEEGLVYDSAEDLAEWLLQNSTNSKLSKASLGELLGGEDDDDTSLLSAFVALLELKGKDLVSALRLFMGTFLVPGEAQKISRIIQVFAEEYVRQNPRGEIPTRDCAFVLSFSLMMLNTDAHNPSILEKDKMTMDQFVRNNRGQWIDGSDPPLELLQRLYREILSEELKVRAKGIPEKQGWVQAIIAGPVKEQRCFCLLIDKTLQWFKNPPGKIVGQEPMRGKISGLVNLLIYPDPQYSEVLLLLKEPTSQFTVEVKGKPVQCGEVSIQFESVSDREAWVKSFPFESASAEVIDEGRLIIQIGPDYFTRKEKERENHAKDKDKDLQKEKEKAAADLKANLSRKNSSVPPVSSTMVSSSGKSSLAGSTGSNGSQKDSPTIPPKLAPIVTITMPSPKEPQKEPQHSPHSLTSSSSPRKNLSTRDILQALSSKTSQASASDSAPLSPSSRGDRERNPLAEDKPVKKDDKTESPLSTSTDREKKGKDRSGSGTKSVFSSIFGKSKK